MDCSDIVASAVTVLGSLVALGIAVWATIERRGERRAEMLADARLFRVRGTGVREPSETGHGGYDFIWHVQHHGPDAVFDVYYEAWRSGDALDGPPSFALTEDIAVPGQDLDAAARLTSEPVNVEAWRVRWRDRHGNEWSADQQNQHTPDGYHGQPPRRAY